MTRRRQSPGRPFDVAGEVEGLRQSIARAEALIHAAEGMIDGVWPADAGVDERRWERLGHLVGGAVEALREALPSGDRIAAGLAKRQKDV